MNDRDEQELKGCATVINDNRIHPSMLGCFVPRDEGGRLLTLNVNTSMMKKFKLGKIMHGMLENPMKLEMGYPEDHTFHANPPRIFMARMKVSMQDTNRFPFTDGSQKLFFFLDGTSH